MLLEHHGGGAAVGTGIWSPESRDSRLAVRNCEFRNIGYPAGTGGAIEVGATDRVAIVDTAFVDLGVSGIDISRSASGPRVTVAGCTFTNFTRNGILFEEGGQSIRPGALRVLDTVFQDRVSEQYSNIVGSTRLPTEVELRDVVMDNTVTQAIGGAFDWDKVGDGLDRLTISNSIFSENTAYRGAAGAFNNLGSRGSGVLLDLIDTAIVRNVTTGGGPSGQPMIMILASHVQGTHAEGRVTNVDLGWGADANVGGTELGPYCPNDYGPATSGRFSWDGSHCP